jgi:cyclopropane fatty-acyl-phospholipid synthase-like methyltransferase
MKRLRGEIAWWRRRSSRRYWEQSWSREDFAPPWLGRDISREIVMAVEEGWFAHGMPALDIGCGEGEVVAWLAEHGFPTLGIDIAKAAIMRARKRFGEVEGQHEFHQLDICLNAPKWLGRTFTNLIDRGCFHQIPDLDLSAYARNVATASSSTARLLLFVKAFRKGEAGEDQRAAERARHRNRVATVLDRHFCIERMGDTFLDPDEGHVPETRLPGLVFWLRRK